MADLPAQIEEIEVQIERLSEAANNCRKVAVVAQLAAAGGGLILISMILGVLRFSPEGLVTSIAAVLGGIALRGTNRRSHDDIKGKIIEAEDRRSTLIDALQLRAVDAA